MASRRIFSNGSKCLHLQFAQKQKPLLQLVSQRQFTFHSTLLRDPISSEAHYTISGANLRLKSTVSSSYPLPIQTKKSNSKTVTPPKIVTNNETFRAETKIQLLKDVQSVTDESKGLYLSSQKHNINEEESQMLYNNWMNHEIRLADAYSKAIKYTAKLRAKDTTLKSRHLLDEMISRHGILNTPSLYSLKSVNGVTDIIIHDDQISEFLSNIKFDTHGRINNMKDLTNKDKVDDINGFPSSIPPPSKQDFHNVLHSWASSKVKRKGGQAETLIWSMIELSAKCPDLFAFPDSKSFALVIKSYGASTYRNALQRIQKLHEFHEILSSIEGSPLEKDDIFILMHSIKSIKNVKKDETLVTGWFDRLHSKIIHQSKEEDAWKAEDAIDLSGTYTSILRGYARENQVQSASQILKKMHEIHDIVSQRNQNDEFISQANIEIKPNAYNLVIGSCEGEKYVPLAMKLLNEMIESPSNTINNDKLSSSIPPPDDQSFALVLKKLYYMSDMNAAKTIGDTYLSQYEKLVQKQMLSPSPNVHNAYMELLIKHFGHHEDLLSMCNAVINRMSNIVDEKKDTTTWNLLLKACTSNNVEKNVEKREERIKIAQKIFNNMEEGVKGELSDQSFQYLMQCYSLFIDDDEDKKLKIIGSFKLSSKLGFVSAGVLKQLKCNVSEEEFTEIVGSGRLVNDWLTNVTTKTVQYTDFTNGGANKHARRKGKSTSNWARQQRQRTAKIQSRKTSKLERKMKRN